jgi:hypothetical protein
MRMPKYLIAYYGNPKFETPQHGKAYMTKWRAWMSGLGEALIDPGAPLNKGKRLSSRGDVSDPGSEFLSGFSILAADDLDGALRLTHGCPHLDHGAVEVAEVMDMKMA